MLHIILLILKIIGIILLCILGLLFLVILSALFVPVRYRVEVTREEGEDKPPVLAYAKVTWFLHFINILAAYPGDVILRVRIMLFTVFRIPGKEKKDGGTKERKTKNKKKKRNKRKEPEDCGEMEEDAQENPAEAAERETSATRKENVNQGASAYRAEDIEGRTEVEAQGEETSDTVTAQEAGSTDGIQEGRKFSLAGKIREIIDKVKRLAIKIKQFFENIQYTIRKFCDKIKSTLDNIEYYRKVLESEPFRQSWQLCKKEISRVLKKLKPDKFEADFIIGMEDPATIGEILAVWGMLYPLIGRHVRLAGDFECGRMRVEGSLYIQGKIRAFTFIRLAVRIYFNKDVRKLIKLLKKEAA